MGLAGRVDVSSAFLGRTKARTLSAERGDLSSVNLGRWNVWLRVRGRRRGVPAVPLGCRFPKSGSPEIPFLDCRLRRKDTSAPSLDGALGTARLCRPWREAGCFLGLKGVPLFLNRPSIPGKSSTNLIFWVSFNPAACKTTRYILPKTYRRENLLEWLPDCSLPKADTPKKPDFCEEIFPRIPTANSHPSGVSDEETDLGIEVFTLM